MGETMTLKAKFITLSAVAIAVIILSAVVGHMSYAKITASSEGAERAAQLMRNHMHADMMHDAVRGSVYQALHAAALHDAKRHAEARAAVDNYGYELAKDIAESISLSDNEALRRTFEGLKGNVVDYRQKALAAADSGSHADFDASFEALEGKFEGVSEEIELHIHSINEAEKAVTDEIEQRSLLSALVTVLIALCIPVFAALQVFRPQQNIIAAMSAISDGKLETQVPYLDRADEIGAMARALAVFRQNAADKNHLEQEAAAQKKKSEEDRRRAMFGLADSFEANVKSVADTVASAATEMDATSRDVMKRAQDSSELLGKLVTGISGASQNVQTVAAAAAELSASIREISQQVTHGSSIMTAAVTEAKRANETALALTDAAEKIGSVVGVINEIAAQINLLSLNATIEAARAGESGKGFAVVASEVKNLAGQTTAATRQIEEQIGLIQQAAGNTAGVITQIGNTITEMNRISASIAAAVEEQGMATQEIARNVQQTAEIARGIASNANDVKQSSTGASAAVSQMIAAASDLSRQSESLRGQVSGFLRDIKSG
jgi:methyl-accepting chemotaxis protein